MIPLFLILILYINIFRYIELKYLTNIRNLKDYFNYNTKICITINFTIIMIFVIFNMYSKTL